MRPVNSERYSIILTVSTANLAIIEPILSAIDNHTIEPESRIDDFLEIRFVPFNLVQINLAIMLIDRVSHNACCLLH